MLILFNFVITMMLFPELTVKMKFKFNFVWSNLIFIFIYGLGDLIGKMLVNINGSYNKASNMYLFFSRLVFFFTIPVMASGAASNDPMISNNVFPFVNQLFFGLSNGFVVSNN